MTYISAFPYANGSMTGSTRTGLDPNPLAANTWRRPSDAGTLTVERRPRVRARSWAAGCCGVALLATLALAAVVVASPARSLADGRPSGAELGRAYPLEAERPSASELWEAYPLHDGPSTADAVSAGGVFMEDMAAGSVGDTSDHGLSSRGMLRLGLVFAALYLAFLAAWFSVTRGWLGLRAEPRVSAGASTSWTARAVEAHPLAERRSVMRATSSMRSESIAVWTCEIGWRSGRARSRFCAQMAGPDCEGWRIVAESTALPWPPPPGATVPTAELVSALDRLESSLVAAGWEPAGSGDSWSARRFVWRAQDAPPAYLGPVEDA